MGAWWPTIGFAALAMVGLGIAAGSIAIGKGQNWLTWLAGAFALAMTLMSGYYGRRTWVGRDLIPWVMSISPYVAIGAFIVVLFAIYRGVLASVPDKVSAVAVVPPIIVAVWLLPSAAPEMPGGKVPDALDKAQTSVTSFLSAKTGDWFTGGGR